MIGLEADNNITAKEQKDNMAKAKRTEYQRWYYQTYTKKRRANGTVKVKRPPRKTAEEKAESYKRAAEKRRQTMIERYGEEGMKEIYAANGQRLARQMAETPEKRYRLNSERAKEIGKKGLEVRRANFLNRKRRKKNGKDDNRDV